MSKYKKWVILPSTDLGLYESWKKIGQNRYAAFRLRLLIMMTHGNRSRFGPIINGYSVKPGIKQELRRKRTRIISCSDSITEAIRFNTSTRICDQLSARISAEMSAKTPGFSGKISSDLETKTMNEYIEGVESSLNRIRTFRFEEIEETEQTIILDGDKGSRSIQLRRRYWPRYWDVYLHSYEYLELEYHRHWIWRHIRNTIKQLHSGMMGSPLLRLTYYEPQNDVDVCYGDVVDEIEFPDVIEVSAARGRMPRVKHSDEETLEELARLAFPQTKKEKIKSVSRKAKAKRKVKAKAKRKVKAKAKRKVKAKAKRKVKAKRKAKRRAH